MFIAAITFAAVLVLALWRWGASHRPGGSPSRGTCAFLWRASVEDMVEYGIGWRVLMMGVTFNKARRFGCDVLVTEDVARSWERAGLKRIWSDSISQEEFDARWEGSTLSGFPNVPQIPAALNSSARSFGWQNPSDYYDMMAHDPDFLDTLGRMFSSLYETYTPLFGLPYAGIHIRQGDKATEGKVFSLEETVTTLSECWPDQRRIFVASNEGSVFSDIENGAFANSSLSFRYSSAEPGRLLLPGYHRHSNDAVRMVLLDLMGLAHASVLVGNWNSYFFRTAWFLNLALRSRDRGEWCFDQFTNNSCSDREAFVDRWPKTFGLRLAEGAVRGSRGTAPG